MLDAIKELFSYLFQFIDDHFLVECIVCKKYSFNKDVTYRRITTWHSVPVCDSCYKDLFYPFTKGDK